MRRLLYCSFLFLLGGCPGSHGDGTSGQLPPCHKFGDSCEFLPGKLGSCVVKDGCESGGPECFKCQSQH